MRAPHARVGQERIAPAGEHDAAGLEHAPAIAALEGFYHPLLVTRSSATLRGPAPPAE